MMRVAWRNGLGLEKFIQIVLGVTDCPADAKKPWAALLKTPVRQHPGPERRRVASEIAGRAAFVEDPLIHGCQTTRPGCYL